MCYWYKKNQTFMVAIKINGDKLKNHVASVNRLSYFG